MPALLKWILPENSFERHRLDAIFSDDWGDDAVEFCCRCVSLETGIEPNEGRRYLAQAECVQDELAVQGIREPSPWLAQLRSSLAKELPAAIKPIASGPRPSGDQTDQLTVPRFPNAGNWTGLILFVAVALACAAFGFWRLSLIPVALSLMSLLTRVNYWVFDRAEARLTYAMRNPLFPARQVTGYSLRDLAAVTLETKVLDDSTGDIVRVVFGGGQDIIVSRHARDADRIAAFLGIEKTIRKI
jgi:hypothetical protein